MHINQNTERAQKPLTDAIYTRTAAASQSSDDLRAQIEACKAVAARLGWVVNDALANKLARIAWAVLFKGEPYRPLLLVTMPTETPACN
jgi:hypothetical protein